MLALLLSSPALAWTNGQPDNANTDTAAECSSPPSAAHDWVAEQALMLLPEAEREWIMPFKAIYLIGTEAPDFKHIPTACQTPHPGYDDRSQGHHSPDRINRSPLHLKKRPCWANLVATEQGDTNEADCCRGARARFDRVREPYPR